MKRREFIKQSLLTASGFAMYEVLEHEVDIAQAFPTSRGMGIEEANYYIDSGKEKNTIPDVRQEIKENPRAVFLIETHVDARKDAEGFYPDTADQLKNEGQRIARQLFVKGTEKGGSTFIKPNFCTLGERRYFKRNNGVYTAPDFIVGVVENLREIGNTNVACGGGSVNAVNRRLGRVYDSFDPYNILMIEAGYQRFEHFNKNELNWSDPVDSPVWNRIPYYKPILDKDNFLINISSMKPHITAITTLTVKNLQGCVPKGYVHFCWPGIQLELQSETAGIDFRRGFQKDAIQNVEKWYARHRAAGFKRWEVKRWGDYDKYLELGGYETYNKVKNDVSARRDFLKQIDSNLFREESWMHRGLDNAKTLKPNLNIIEGIIGMEGCAHDWNGKNSDYLVNIVVAGCSPFEVDAVGSYIMGHDPREVWYTRVAKEKGYGECDPEKIDIFLIRENGDIVPVKNLAGIKRVPLGLDWYRSGNPDDFIYW